MQSEKSVEMQKAESPSAKVSGSEILTGTVTVTGRVRLVGNAPFSELIITAEKGDWYIERDEEYKLMDLQQQMVTVEGSETVMELKFASGVSAGERRTLKNIKIISSFF